MMTTACNRREAVLGAAALLAVPAAWAAPDASEKLLPTSSNLKQSLEEALARGEPLIVLATLRGCPFCKVARENYLVSELKAGRAVTQIHFLLRDPVVDLQGNVTTQGALVKQLQVEAAPTLLFFGKGAKEVAPRLVGGSTSDFYAAYLDERVALARRNLNT